MRKFTFSFKSLLVACGLLLGSANAWALTETFGEGKATDKNTYIIGTSVNIHKDSNPSGAGPLAVFNSKTDKGIKLRTIQSTTPLTLVVNPGYKVTNVTINAYQNNTTGTITEVNPKVWTVKHYCSFGADSDIVQDSFLLV